MNLAKVLKKVLSNSSPTTVAAADKTTLRVITEEDYANEVADLNHFEDIQRIERSLVVLQSKLNKLEGDVSSSAGRTQILVEAGISVNNTEDEEAKLWGSLKVILEDFERTTKQFNEAQITFSDLMNLTLHTRVNLLFTGDLSSMSAFGINIKNTIGVYKDDGSGVLEGFLDYLTIRTEAIRKRIAIQNGPNNPNRDRLRAQLKINYWADSVGVQRDVRQFIANTEARELKISGTYKQKRNQAQAQNFITEFDNMPAPDSAEVRKLTDAEIQALMDDVDAALGASTTAAVDLTQAIDAYTQLHTAAAANLDKVATLGTVLEVNKLSTDRTNATITIKKYDSTYVVSDKPLTTLETLAESWKDAAKEYNKTHMQDPNYYMDTHPNGSILNDLEDENTERKRINTDNKVLTLYTNTKSGNPANIRVAQASAATNGAWESLVIARSNVLKKANDLFVEKDFPTDPLSSLTNAELDTEIARRQVAANKLDSFAKGVAYSTIIANTFADLTDLLAKRETVVRELENHLGGEEFKDLLTEPDAKIQQWLTTSRIKFEDTAVKIKNITGNDYGIDWKSSGINGLTDIETALTSAESERTQEIKKFEGQLPQNQTLPPNFESKSIPDIKNATTQLILEKKERKLKEDILKYINNAVATAITGEGQLDSLTTNSDIENLEDSFNQLLSELAKYDEANLKKMVSRNELSPTSRDTILRDQKSVVASIDKLLSKLSQKKSSLVAQTVSNKRSIAFAELNKRFDDNPGIILKSADVVTLDLTAGEVLKKLELERVKMNTTYNIGQQFDDFAMFVDKIDGIAFLKNCTNIDEPHSSGRIGFVDSFVGSNGTKIKLCGDKNSPFRSCSIGFFQGGVFHSTWARVVPNTLANKVVGADEVEVKKNLTELSTALKGPNAVAEDLKNLTMPIYIDLENRKVFNPLRFIDEVIEVQEFIMKEAKNGRNLDVERRSQARDQSNLPLAFAFRDNGVTEDIPLDEVLDFGGTQDAVSYLIAPSGSKDQADVRVMFKWFKDVIDNGTWADKKIRETVQNIVNKLYPDSIYNDKDQRTEGSTKGGKITFVDVDEPKDALAALDRITAHYKSSLRIIRFVPYDSDGGKIKNGGDIVRLKALWQSNYDIKAFKNIKDVTEDLRKEGIMVWADTDDLDNYNGARAINTSAGGTNQEYLLDTDDEDVVSFRFTPNI